MSRVFFSRSPVSSAAVVFTLILLQFYCFPVEIVLEIFVAFGAHPYLCGRFKIPDVAFTKAGIAEHALGGGVIRGLVFVELFADQRLFDEKSLFTEALPVLVPRFAPVGVFGQPSSGLFGGFIFAQTRTLLFEKSV